MDRVAESGLRYNNIHSTALCSPTRAALITGRNHHSAGSLLNASYTITADIEVPEGGAEGMVLTSGGRFAGYGFYLLEGKPVFLGTLAFNNMSGLAQPGTGTLSVNGKVVDTQRTEKTMPMMLQWDEAFDIGSDTLTGVNDADYKPPFTLTAKLDKLTIKVDRPVLSAADIEKLKTAQTNNSSSE
jgi:arylsulfatase